MNKNSSGAVSPGPSSRLAVSIRCWVLCLAIAGFGGNAVAEELVQAFNGDGSKLTGEFDVDGPWLLDWHVTSDFPKQAGIEIDLVESVFLDHIGNVLIARDAGAGTKLFYDKGRFRFRIMANAIRWRLRVSRITEEEAAKMIRISK